MAKIPDRAEHQRRFVALTMAERRAIIRAVNRGQAVDVRKHAPLAVGVARRQQRFWRYAWLIGPVMGLAQLLFFGEPQAAISSAVFGTLVLVLIAWFWRSRAQRSELRNLEIVEGRRSPGDNQPSARETSRRGWRKRSPAPEAPEEDVGAAADTRPVRGHLPGRLGAEPDTPTRRNHAEPTSEVESELPEPIDPSRRPYRPRGRKRRPS